jgi:hypothetical protein
MLEVGNFRDPDSLYVANEMEVLHTFLTTSDFIYDETHRKYDEQ